mmetsp:Transcript_17285/g.36312  ORF Transcript_17285/g.36312 Transcript_17285/m.36312 type:complete len:871 (-) Transcript_17285:405-3017(-)
MKKTGLKPRSGVGGSARGGKQQQHHQRHYHHANNNNNAAVVGDGSSSSGENDAFLHNQNYATSSNTNNNNGNNNNNNNATMKNTSYQKGSNFQPMSATASNLTTATARHPQQPQQPMGIGNGYSSQPPQFSSSQQQQQHAMGIPNNNTNNGGGMLKNNNGPNALMRLRQQKQQQTHASSGMALNQKNHRLAKELSDLRVRHREETQVVSRLTMENMNLASRCREAIAQVASLKKEIVVYQKRQSEWGTLQREVMLLRNQIDKNAAAAAATAASSSPGNNSSGHNRSSSDEQQHRQQQKQSSALTSSHSYDRGMERKRISSPSTDLDRIMSQQLKKQENSSAATAGTATATTIPSLASECVGNGSVNEKKDASAGLVKKLQDLNVSSSTLSPQRLKNSNTALGSNTNGEASASSSSNSKTNKYRPNSNAKIPISVTSSSKLPNNSTQKDDEFDADIDMVDFFAKSQPALNNGSNNTASSAPGGSLEPSSSIHHLGSRTRHARKPVSTDDHMPEDVISPTSQHHHQGGGRFSPSPSHNQGSSSSPPVGDNLLSSLDAFEASFASAFPETSFSITSEAPISSAKLDMSFDVPDFDPFFKSPTNIGKDNAHSSSFTSSSTGNKINDGIMKSQMQDLFPESAMKFKPSTPNKSDGMVFDYSNPMNFSPMELSNDSKKGPGALSLAVSPEKLGPGFIPIHTAAKGKPLNITTSDLSNKDNEKETSQPTLQKQRPRGNRPLPLSPQSMSAEIEQLDVIANLASSEKSESSKNVSSVGSATAAAANNNNSALNRSTRSVRKVKQPVSYAEPSTKSKLRRGDVLFPKVDATDKTKKTELESAIRSKGPAAGRGVGRAGATAANPATDLDRIMGQMSDMQ